MLGLALAADLRERFPEASSGELTEIRKQAVRASACAAVGRELGLLERLAERSEWAAEKLAGAEAGRRFEELTVGDRPLAEVTEAAIGACFLTHGYDTTAEAVVAAFGEQIALATETRLDFKSELQERLARDGATVSYEVVGEKGPPHDRRFEVTANAEGEELGSGSGRSKKEAEQAAAEKALERMRR